jgi:hypothetical protein
VDRHDRRADVERLAQVLDGLSYPAARWQVIAQADHYGADSVSRAQLTTLPIGTYPDLVQVLAALGLLVDRRRRTAAVSAVPAVSAVSAVRRSA